MIDKKLKREDLLGKKVKVLFGGVRNGAGNAVSEESVCYIVEVTPGHGFTIKTEKCPHCGQSTYITHIKRERLELL